MKFVLDSRRLSKIRTHAAGRRALDGKRVLSPRTVQQMSKNQIGDLSVVELHSLIPQLARDPVRVPGSLVKFGLGFGSNSKPLPAGRSSGSIAWAGINNTFFWIDPSRKTCAVLMMQTVHLQMTAPMPSSKNLNAQFTQIFPKRWPGDAWQGTHSSRQAGSPNHLWPRFSLTD